MGNFIGWLGYDQTPVTARPASRIRKGQAIFVTPVVSSAEPRLTRLGNSLCMRPPRTFMTGWLRSIAVQ